MNYKDAWRIRTRQWAINLLGGKCAWCDGEDDLQFDHRDPASKSFAISQGIVGCFSRIRLEVELAKCQLLCVTCHREKSALEKSVPHGGGKSGKKNCPCEACRARKKEYMNNFLRSYIRPRDRGVSGSI